MTTVNAPEFVRHPKLIAWVEEIANLTKPAKIEWCDGSEEVSTSNRLDDR